MNNTPFDLPMARKPGDPVKASEHTFTVTHKFGRDEIVEDPEMADIRSMFAEMIRKAHDRALETTFRFGQTYNADSLPEHDLTDAPCTYDGGHTLADCRAWVVPEHFRGSTLYPTQP